MKIGTKTLLLGYHQVLIHAIFVAIAWTKLFGFPFDPRLWIAFIIHDMGYWGKPNLDGPEGESHPEWAANLMGKWFGNYYRDLCLYHSRFYALKDNKPVSKLCAADKLAYCLYPNWLILFLNTLSDEQKEYDAIALRRGLAYSSKETIMMWKNHSREWLRLYKEGKDQKHTQETKDLDYN